MGLKINKTSAIALGYSYDPRRDGVTQSMLGTFLSCPEKAQLSIFEGYASVKNTFALSFGTLFHAAKDIMYSGIKESPLHTKMGDVALGVISQRAAAALETLYALEVKKLEKSLAAEQLRQQFELEFGLVERVFKRYVMQWADDFTEREWIELEEVFEVPVTFMLNGKLEAITLRGKRDKGFRDNKKALWLGEVKTKSIISDEAIADKLSFEIQVMIYMYAMWVKYKEKPVGVMYDLIRRPSLKQGKQSLEEYLDRVEADLLERQDTYFLRYSARIQWKHIAGFIGDDLPGMLQNFLRLYDKEYRYKNSQECTGKYGTCPFLSACAYGDKTYLSRKERPFMELEISE